MFVGLVQYRFNQLGATLAPLNALRTVLQYTSLTTTDSTKLSTQYSHPASDTRCSEVLADLSQISRQTCAKGKIGKWGRSEHSTTF
jgi:hypothetical protein